MDAQTVFVLKQVLLTEALTHAVRNWGIFDDVRSRIAGRSDFFSRLLSCYECSAVWIATAVFAYLYFLDFWPITLIILGQRLATILHMGIEALDAWRASTINKI